MTRINCVPVEELSGPHLVAEYRELPRVFALAEKAATRGALSQPSNYTLGKGHLLFFYTRLGFLAERHAALVEEMKRRGYKPSFGGIRRKDFPSIPDSFWGSWEPTEEALRINRQRIKERSPLAAQALK
ncbi:pyrimidine dimer DNA glycosylase/endonuclease V [Paracandidimonas soli]|uniref:Pyrimidine dimer DNA glycosylase /DNA-(Apurinic or apyrimidinic site) lyase n=1 Tax=Paracandidimonas soli TaxID=1917182 RepID=A0A4R3VE19_9BURK|nr:pyrimidine dimer DNA glycosylase/endonuclease V [Paracandidimonas soli]TCV01859.1 pyrimidine dimer DNA glycosylase /DNA-(apurinic or apyrimidinic site) lyase [Paracandidimonas soli]